LLPARFIVAGCQNDGYRSTLAQKNLFYALFDARAMATAMVMILVVVSQ